MVETGFQHIFHQGIFYQICTQQQVPETFARVWLEMPLKCISGSF